MVRSVSVVSGRGVIALVGGIYVVLAVGLVYGQSATNPPVRATPMEVALLVVPGIVLLYGGYRLSGTEIHPEFYSTIARWCLGGFGLMVAILALYHLQPDTSVSTSNSIAPVLTALSSVAGYGIGLHSARTKELQRTRERLDTTVERLRTSNQRLEQFAYAASHDLQEPLRMVSSYLRFLERRCGDDLDEEGREFLEIAVDGADRMLEMVDGLLRYSRVAASDERFEPVDLNAILEDVRTDLRMRIEEENAEITAESLPTVAGHGDQLYQVFQNLLSNAIDYSGEGAPRIHVSAERAGPMWAVTVRDDGIGIDPMDIDSVFELFQRVPTDEDHAGSGIGLALCEQIVERHGGEIRVDSEPGEGSAFSFTLPAIEGGEGDD
ncbi:methyl sulfide methyltransferase-associated sensor [Halalkalicoccus paucihalophilus]|uniref:histidine kinase n=1 Tax=Halalkalicoccus paucihalophilus TaxID=1008153 RepID=A0A151AI79_9EURY|nr:ATP-binding protein [Halalkalicoccus paucihalophilus]KYH27378.1 methyl sulfide methyltransferase-associated sensor [Halalkalicoccus paucihalophilus]